MYKVSIIIPVYNVEKYILSSLKSALSQSLDSIEYIIIDDCGQDNSINIIKNYINNHPRKNDIFIYKHDKNKGLSAARNTGLLHATSKYIYFMDSDDEITPDCIELHYNSIIETKADFTVSNIQLIGVKSIHIKPIPSHIENTPPILSYLKGEWNVSACNKLYDIEVIKKNNLSFKENLIHEDILWNYLISSKSTKIAQIQKATYLYKVREGSIVTSPNSRKKIESLLYIISILYKDWNSLKINEEFSSQFVAFFNYWRFVTALQLLNFAGTKEESLIYYNQIKSYKINKFNKGLYHIILKLPFNIFTLIKPIYHIYKKK